jgi:spore maturation protein CgeB
MKHFLVLGAFEDLQTGVYIVNSIEDAGHKADYIDIRQIYRDAGAINAQQVFINEIDKLNINPDIILVLKGLEISKDTLQTIKDKYKKAKLINWFFDVYAGDKPIYENTDYLEALKLFDYYFCSLKGVSDILREKGYNNAYYLDEACCPEANGEQYMNYFQINKYGNDISFCGSIGFTKMHKDRLRLLNLISKECYNLTIHGPIYMDWKYVSEDIRRCHSKDTTIINEKHSMVCQSSLINLGIDQDINVDMGFSARLFRVMCAGGLYLNTNTKGLNKMFKINETKESPITDDLELVVFYDDEDLCNKLDFLLEHDDIRKKIAKNGQKVVLEKHTFVDRIKEMIEILGE